ncbi:MAG TPA: hypothetical protein VFQ91_23045 [Bryobacteraceae bacterium]|nr:hypothetical protein [Bryobacteraceae bacterium]
MALFVDGNPSQITDLANYESAIVEVAATEGIDLTAKLTVAALEVGLELQRFLVRTPGGMRFSLGHVALTEGVKQWHTLLALSATYRDAHFQQLNDRHKHKWKEYERLARASADLLFDTGVGLLFYPLAKPVQPLLGQQAGALPARTYYVRVTWVDADGVESSPSETAGLTTQEGTALTVRTVGAPARAQGWNVYAGMLDDQVQRQNTSLLTVGSTWVMPASGLEEGPVPGTGQTAEYYLRHIPVLQRG